MILSILFDNRVTCSDGLQRGGGGSWRLTRGQGKIISKRNVHARRNQTDYIRGFLTRIRFDIFLGAFAKLLNATISFALSVSVFDRPPAWTYSTPTGRIFMKFGI
jgi:hypothetical protein